MNKEEQFPQPKKEITSNYKANINDWAEAARGVDAEFADKIDEERTVGSKNLDKFNLKRYKHIDLPLGEFLQNSHEIMEQLESDIFYVSLKPINRKELRREGRAGLNEKEVNDFVNEFVAQENINDYEIAIEQMFPNIFGGNVVIDSKGNVYFEFVSGNQTAISKGSAETKYVAFRDVFTGSFKYSFEDENVRKLVYDAIVTIPHKGEGREMQFMPGYYEMVIAQRDEKSKPENFFVDYRDNEAYQIDWDKVKLIS